MFLKIGSFFYHSLGVKQVKNNNFNNHNNELYIIHELNKNRRIIFIFIFSISIRKFKRYFIYYIYMYV